MGLIIWDGISTPHAPRWVTCCGVFISTSDILRTSGNLSVINMGHSEKVRAESKVDDIFGFLSVLALNPAGLARLLAKAILSPVPVLRV